MHILVTGANGQLGSELKELYNVNNKLTFDFHDVDTLNLLNLEELELYFKKNEPDFVINCAAYTAVDKAEDDKEGALKGNSQIVKNLVEFSEKYNCYFIHISTDYVFDGENYIPYTELDITNPQGIYGETKLKGESEALKYLKTIIIRTSWLYSSFGNNFLKTMLRLGKEKKELNVIFDQIGSPTYARDLAKSILNIITLTLKKNANFVPGIYHFSNEGVCSWYDFAIEIFELSDIKCFVNPIETSQYPTPAKRPHYSVLNKKKIKETFNMSIPHWKSSLKECLQLLEK